MKLTTRFSILAFVAAVVLAPISAAYAGNTTFLTDKNGQITFPFSPPNRATGGPAAIDNTAIGQTTPAPGTFTTLQGAFGNYVKNIPLTGFSLAATKYQTLLVLNPAGTLAAGTVTLPPSPPDGLEFCIFSTQIVTALTLTPVSPATVNNGITALTVNGRFCYLYSASDTKWDRSQ